MTGHAIARAEASDVSHRLPIALYPLVLSVALVVELFVVSGVSPFAALRTLVVVVAFTLLISAAARVLLVDRDRAGTVSCLTILLFFAGGDVRIAVALGTGLAILLLEKMATGRRPEKRPLIRWQVVGRFLAAVITVLAIAIGIQAVQSGTGDTLARAVTSEAPFHPSRNPIAPGSGDRPDIYLVLLDGFAREDVLEEVFDVDGPGISAALEDRGFSVSAHSRSNYAITTQTLASMFEMRPVQEIELLKPLLVGEASRPEGALVRQAINEGAALGLLRDLGYEIHAVASGYEEPALRQAESWTDTGELNEFELAILRRSIAKLVLPIIAPDFVSSQFRSRTEGVLNALEATASTQAESPRFVFGHVPSPHAPWVHNADGSPRTVVDLDAILAETPLSTGLTWAELRAGYAGQVTWLTDRVLATVDEIIARSERPPVIVLFSDHGTWIGADEGDIRLRFRILLAARDAHGRELIPDTVATVDLFPILFRQLFGLDLPTHPDTPSYMTGPDAFDLREVPDPE